ncbi:hypothetical protein [Macrococcus capreoli]|uniref:hypothetical protein n=1 Tax=Macrococcus capreoli TaxID=2982690 RepID=UPI003F43851C
MQFLISNDKESYRKVIRKLLDYADTILITTTLGEDFTQTIIYQNLLAEFIEMKVRRKWPGTQGNHQGNLYYFHYNERVVNEIKLFNCFYKESIQDYSPIELDIDIAFLKHGKSVLYSIAHEYEVRVIDNQLAGELKQMGLKVEKFAR